MDIKDPEISRILAKLIQGVPYEQRDNFVAKAEKSPDLKSFLTNDLPPLRDNG